MVESKAKKLPQFDSTKELIDFFDTHDLGEYGEDLPEVIFACFKIAFNVPSGRSPLCFGMLVYLFVSGLNQIS